MIAKAYQGSVVSFRNDRMGARFLSILNAIRLSKDYDFPYFFTWMTHGRASEELHAPTEIFDEEFFETHFVSKDDFKDIDKDGTDFSAFPIGMNEESFRQSLKDKKTYVCMATELFTLPWEDVEQVAQAYSDAISELKFSKVIQDAMDHVDQTLSGNGVAFHIRRGDIVYDPVTSNQLWSNKYIPREYYEVLADKLINSDDARILVFSDEPKEIERLQKLSDRVLSPDSVLPKGLTLAQRDFMEIYAMSRCHQIVGPPGSGFSAAAGLMGNHPVTDIRTHLTNDEQNAAMARLTKRLAEERDYFLSDGDLAQSLPFALQYLDESGQSELGLKVLLDAIEAGVSKTFVFRLLLEQHVKLGQFDQCESVLERMKVAKTDRAIPARLELHWSDLYRLAAIGSVHAGELEMAARRFSMALWFHPTSRVATNAISRLVSMGELKLEDFPIPVDPQLRRPAMRAVPPEGHPRLALPHTDDPNSIFAGDLLVWDWAPFLGKTLIRGFNTEAAIEQRRDLFVHQFSRHCPAESIASGLGVYALALGDVEEAERQQDIALRASPNNPLFLKRSAAVRLAKDPTDPVATVLLEKASHISPSNSLYHAALALSLIEQEQVDRGIKILKRLSADPNVLPEVPFLAARTIRRTGKNRDEALLLVNQSLKTAPHVKRYMQLRVHLLADLKNWQEANSQLDSIIARFGEAGDLAALRQRLAA